MEKKLLSGMKNQNMKIFLETMNLEYYRLKKGPVGLLLVRGSQLGNTVGENVHRACALNDMKISEQHAQSLFSRECINYFRITTLVKYAINF